VSTESAESFSSATSARKDFDESSEKEPSKSSVPDVERSTSGPYKPLYERRPMEVLSLLCALWLLFMRWALGAWD
jgi:hypothetical protein